MKKNNSAFVAGTNENSIPLATFIEATSQWEYVNNANRGMIGDVVLANHFDIPMDDFTQIVDEISKLGPEQAVGARAYIGIERIDGADPRYQMKLYFTGVNESFEPILTNENGSAIYDFVTPCPPTCEGGGGIS